jgi:hypothetical protein
MASSSCHITIKLKSQNSSNKRLPYNITAHLSAIAEIKIFNIMALWEDLENKKEAADGTPRP